MDDFLGKPEEAMSYNLFIYVIKSHISTQFDRIGVIRVAFTSQI